MNKVAGFFSGINTARKLGDDRWIFGTMLAGSILSLLASFVLSVEAIELARNPDAVLSCSVNVVLNCATVGLHPSAYLFGFPNSFLGLIAEPVVITVAVAGLMRVRFPRQFMFVAQTFYSLGFLFAYYLLYTSMFVIGALCPWCLLVTVTTTFVFFSMTRYNIRENNLYLPHSLQRQAEGYIKKDYDKLLLFALVALVVAGILVKYRDGLFGV